MRWVATSLTAGLLAPLLAACATPHPLPEAAGTPAEPAARQHVLVVSHGPMASGQVGSGVALDANRIVTNRHVVAPRGAVLPVRVTLPDGQERRVVSVATSDRMDLAVLALDGAPLSAPCWRSTGPALGEPQWLLGSPASGRAVLNGRVVETAVPDGKFGTLYAVTAAAVPGYSGGAAVDRAGCVAGITTAASGVGATARAWALSSNEVLHEVSRIAGFAALPGAAASERAEVAR